MGYPPIFAEAGFLSSWGSANFYSVLLSRMAPNAGTIAIRSEPIDITPAGAAQRQFMPSLGTHEFTVESEAFATPRLGNVGLVTFSAGGYTQHIRSYVLTIQAPAEDITEFTSASSGEQWRRFRPLESAWTATIEAAADTATALVNPHLIGTGGTIPSLPTVTFNFGTTSIQLAGSAFLSQLDVRAGRGQQTLVTYTAQGVGTLSSGTALTPSGTGNPFGASAFGIPVWSEDLYLTGPYAGGYVFTTYSGRTITGQDSFWKSITLRVEVGRPVSISVQAQGSGTLTMA